MDGLSGFDRLILWLRRWAGFERDEAWKPSGRVQKYVAFDPERAAQAKRRARVSDERRQKAAAERSEGN